MRNDERVSFERELYKVYGLSPEAEAKRILLDLLWLCDTFRGRCELPSRGQCDKCGRNARQQ